MLKVGETLTIKASSISEEETREIEKRIFGDLTDAEILELSKKPSPRYTVEHGFVEEISRTTDSD